jgi:hypothetical protein
MDNDEAEIGLETSYAAGDHVHPHDTWFQTGMVNLLPESSIRFDYARIITDSNASIEVDRAANTLLARKRTTEAEGNISLDISSRAHEFGENYMFSFWVEVEEPVEFALTLVDLDGTEYNIGETQMAYLDTSVKRFSWMFRLEMPSLKTALLRWASEEDIKFHYGFTLVRGVFAPDFIMSPKSIIAAHDLRYLFRNGDLTGGDYTFYGNLNYGVDLTVKEYTDLFTDTFNDENDYIVRLKPYMAGGAYDSIITEGLGVIVQGNDRISFINMPNELKYPNIGSITKDGTTWESLIYIDKLSLIPDQDNTFTVGSASKRFIEAFLADQIVIGDDVNYTVYDTTSIHGFNENGSTIELFLEEGEYRVKLGDYKFVYNGIDILISPTEFTYGPEKVFHSGMSLIPSTDDLYDLGSKEFTWNTIYVHTLEPEYLNVTKKATFRRGIDIYHYNDELLAETTAIRFYFKPDDTIPTAEIYEPLRNRLRIDARVGIRTTNVSYDFSVYGDSGLQGNVRTYNLEAWDDNVYDVGIVNHKYRNGLFGGTLSSTGMTANVASFGDVVIDKLEVKSTMKSPGELILTDLTVTGLILGNNITITGELEARNVSASETMSTGTMDITNGLSAFNADIFNMLRSNRLAITTDLTVEGVSKFEGPVDMYLLNLDNLTIDHDMVSTYEPGDAIDFVSIKRTRNSINVLYDDHTIKIDDENDIYADLTTTWEYIPDAPLVEFEILEPQPTITNGIKISSPPSRIILKMNSKIGGVNKSFTTEAFSWIQVKGNYFDPADGVQYVDLYCEANPYSMARSQNIKITQTESNKSVSISIVQDAFDSVYALTISSVSGGTLASGAIRKTKDSGTVTVVMVSTKSGSTIGTTMVLDPVGWATISSNVVTFTENTGGNRTVDLKVTQAESNKFIVIPITQTGVPVFNMTETEPIVFGRNAGSTVIREIESHNDNAWVNFNIVSPSDITKTELPNQLGIRRNYLFTKTTGNLTDDTITVALVLEQQ